MTIAAVFYNTAIDVLHGMPPQDRLSQRVGFWTYEKIEPYKMQSTGSCGEVVRALVELQFAKENAVFSCLGVVSSWPRRS